MSTHKETTLYTQVPDALIERYGLTVACVYGRIRRYARTQACTARLKTIADDLSIDERTVRRSVETLEAGGFLRVARSRGRTNTIRLSGRLQFAETADTEAIELAGATPDTMSAPTADMVSALLTNRGHDVRTTTDMMSALPRTSCPDTSDTMSGRIKKQVKKQPKRQDQDTTPAPLAADAAAAGPRGETFTARVSPALVQATGFRGTVAGGKPAAWLGRCLAILGEATGDDPAAAIELLERIRRGPRWRFRKMSTREFPEWLGGVVADLQPSESAAATRDWGWGT